MLCLWVSVRRKWATYDKAWMSWQVYAEHIHKQRVALLGLCGGTLVVVLAVLLPRLEPSNSLPLLFPVKHNVQRFIDYTQEVGGCKRLMVQWSPGYLSGAGV